MQSKHRHSILKSFAYAVEGFAAAFKGGRNFRIQTVLGLIAVMLAIVFKLSPQEWVTLIMIIAMVLILELLNTTIETIVDMVSPEISVMAKLAKDISAASVLVAAVASVIIGAFLFLPKLIQ